MIYYNDSNLTTLPKEFVINMFSAYIYGKLLMMVNFVVHLELQRKNN